MIVGIQRISGVKRERKIISIVNVPDLRYAGEYLLVVDNLDHVLFLKGTDEPRSVRILRSVDRLHQIRTNTNNVVPPVLSRCCGKSVES